MVDFKNMKGGDPEGQAKNNSKKPEEIPYPDKAEMEEMLDDKLKEAPIFSKFHEGLGQEYNFYLSPLEKQLILYNSYVNLFEDFIEDIIVDGIKDLDLDVAEAEDYVAVREKRLKEAFSHAGYLREVLHMTIETKLRRRFSIQELIQLAKKIEGKIKDAS